MVSRCNETKSRTADPGDPPTIPHFDLLVRPEAHDRLPDLDGIADVHGVYVIIGEIRTLLESGRHLW